MAPLLHGSDPGSRAWAWDGHGIGGCEGIYADAWTMAEQKDGRNMVLGNGTKPSK